jgi:microcompartment protein CcmL/EutN
MKNAFGMIESKGFVALVEAVDVILKNSPVDILGIKKLENGLVSLVIKGKSEYVEAAMQAAINSGERVGEIYSHTIIEDPNDSIIILIEDIFAIEKNKLHNKEDEIEIHTEYVIKKSDETIKKSSIDKSKPITLKRREKRYKQSNINSPIRNREQKKEITEEIIEPRSEPGTNLDTITRLRNEALGISKSKESKEEVIIEKKEANTSKSETHSVIDFDYIKKLNVHKLRHFARQFQNFPIKGRQISKANREELIELFNSLK